MEAIFTKAISATQIPVGYQSGNSVLCFRLPLLHILLSYLLLPGVRVVRLVRLPIAIITLLLRSLR